ncbi:MAG: hypothetical protein K8H88_20235 [Sandaracinaceae bacterium]|nr:hypothetical protein [Sandaracinaceae bacterium]
MGHYSTRERWLPCESCGAPLTVPIEGGTGPCPKCGAQLSAPPRPDTRVPPTPRSDEMGRRARLRPQDGRPILPPAGFEPLCAGSEIAPHKMQEAWMVWTATRRQLLSSPGDLGAAERLVWLTMMLRNTLTDERAIRALVEGALEVLMLPRHRQSMLGHLARGAAKEHDLGSAGEWLERCDPSSEDLQADSAYRVSRALYETARGDFTMVLEVLGATEEEVPIDDSMDPIAVVLRANAWERVGRVDAAQNELTKFMTRGGMAATVESVIANMPAGWTLCPQSIGVARTQVRAAVGQRAVSQAGGAIGWVLVGAGLIPVVLMFVFLLSGEWEWPMLTMLIFPLIMTPIGLGMIRGGMRAKEIAQHGIHGQGKIVAVSGTGTKINGTPLMKIDVEVSVPGHAPVVASSKRLMHGGGHLIGHTVSVIWHPKYPSEVVLDA